MGLLDLVTIVLILTQDEGLLRNLRGAQVLHLASIHVFERVTGKGEVMQVGGVTLALQVSGATSNTLSAVIICAALGKS